MPISPLISIIVPNYNHGKYLTKRLDSIFNQTYKNFEVIILDDASTDSSKDIIETYRQKTEVTYININEVNSGSTFKQWELGISKATGDFIWIAESDDYCDKIFLEDLISNLTANTVLAYCQSIYIDTTDKILYQSAANYIYQHLNGNDFIAQHMLYGNGIFNASMCIWKKSCYEQVSKEFLKYKFCGDWIFWNEMATQGDVLISGKFHNYYRQHIYSVSHNFHVTGVAIEEVFLAIHYFSQKMDVYKLNLHQIIAHKINQLYYNKNFIKAYKKVSNQHLAIKYPHLLQKIAYLKSKQLIKKLWRG